MAGVARRGGMRAQQREAVEMVLHRLGVGLPTLHGVAAFALRSKLAPVKIGMAIGALGTRRGKNSRDVARITPHLAVRAAQWIVGLGVVIEFRHGPDGGPSGGCMAILAGNGKPPVRILNGALRGGRTRQRRAAREGYSDITEPLTQSPTSLQRPQRAPALRFAGSSLGELLQTFSVSGRTLAPSPETASAGRAYRAAGPFPLG